MIKSHSFPSIRLTVILFALAAGPLRAELPPEAQAAMKKGVMAAQQQDFPLAIRFFQDARKLSPGAPEVFYNLGLAESKIPGRELRAIAWLGAYLAAYPAAPNAKAVLEQIDALDVINQSNTARFLRNLQEAASQLTNSTKYYERYVGVPFANFERTGGLQAIMELWAETGDIAAAINVANLAGSDHRSDNYCTIAQIQVASGDLDGAQNTINLIQGADEKTRAQKAIDEAKAKIGTNNTSIPPPSPASDIPPNAQTAIPVSDWLKQLGIYDYGSTRGIFQTNLNREPFLDLTGYLLSLKTSLPSKIADENLQDEIYRRSEAKVYFDVIVEAAKTIVAAQNDIAGMEKKQTQQPAKR